MISFSIALAFIAVVVVLGVRDMRAQASRERVVLAELQGKYDAERRELNEALIESNAARVAIETRAAEDRAAHKTAWEDHNRRIAELEGRMRNLTAPGVRR